MKRKWFAGLPFGWQSVPDTGAEASGNGSSVVDGSSFQLHQLTGLR